MELLEKNYEWASDGTYLAFKYFMNQIVPEYIYEGVHTNIKKVYIPICNKEDGVYIGNYNLGRIYYREFIGYIYGLLSYAGLKIVNPKDFPNETLMPFDLDLLYKDYVLELEADELIYTKQVISGQSNDLMNITRDELTENAKDNFSKVILKDIISDAFQGKYKVDDVLDSDGVTCICKTLYLPLEIKNDELLVGGYNLGKINITEFLNFLTTLPGYYGNVVDKYNFDGDYLLSYDLKSLIKYYFSQVHQDKCSR